MPIFTDFQTLIPSCPILTPTAIDWESRLPVVLGPCKSRLSLFTRKQQKLLNKATDMEGVPDLSALLKGKLQMLSTKSSSAGVSNIRPSLVEGDTNVEPSAQNPTKKEAGKAEKRIAEGEQSASLEESVPLEEALSSADAPKVSKKKKKKKDGKKRPREDPSIDQNEASTVVREFNMGGPAQTGSTEASSEERPKKRAKKKSVEDGARRSIDGDHSDDLPATEDPSRSGGKASGSKGDPRNESPSSERAVPTSATRKGVQSEGARIHGGTTEFPPIGDLYFKDEYIDAPFTRKHGDRSMNYLVEKYDSALKQTMIQLGAAEKLARTRLSAIERLRAENKKANNKAAEEKEVLRVKFEELEGKLKTDRLAKKELRREKIRLEQTVASLEKEKAKREEERDAVVETLVKERQRLRDSRIQEVTRERVKVQTAMADKSTRCFGRVRDHLARLDAFEKAKNLYGQASGTSKCLEVIRDNGTEIPQEMINIFIEQEKLHEAEVARLRLDPLSESDLTLSILNLPSKFVSEEFMATLDPYGSNVGLIGSESASQLITSREVVEDQSRELAVDVISAPTERVAAMEEKSPEKENHETGDILIQEGGTENVGPEDHVLVSDISSKRREDEEGESNRGEKTPSLRPNVEEVTSEVGKGSTSSIPSLGVDLPAPVEGPTVSAAEDP
ncbi:hypothetical protein F2Q69_00030467 [Brassica cretica]|uniref:Uncharacterized protein n=1 Tax=Brassica cretica TaxID=69181 RepID=A0A8S9S070_BRACR|nr:hypothetical protein F2Q69_00030467 [Brassica cretica]